jgi:hypothetical protein
VGVENPSVVDDKLKQAMVSEMGNQ